MKVHILSFLTIIPILFVGTVIGQTNAAQTPSKKDFTIKKLGTFEPSAVKTGFDAQLKREKEAPVPGGNSYKSFLIEQKRKARALYAARKNDASQVQSLEYGNAPQVKVLQNYGLYNAYIPALDTARPITGGTPLDNTMAISNDGFLMVSINSKVYAHDLNADTAIYKPSQYNYTIGFQQFAAPLEFDLNDFPFDPKLLFDPVHQRFIMTFLAGRSPSDSRIVVGFSTSTNPADPWNMYEITGNPRNLNEWTDYPAIAVTKDDLFYTVNLIESGVSWQEGFRGSIIWQVPLDEAYSGASSLPVTLWDDIKFEGKYTRNLCPIEGAEGPMGPNMYFLSNRNFDLQNDSIFLIEVTDSYASGNAELKVSLGITSQPYGMPPNGQQEDTDLDQDSTSGLQTNDSRMLGGFLHNNNIQYVANTMNFNSGLAAVYHGTIKDVNGNPDFSGKVIGDDVKDFGYPNIAFTGTSDEETEAIIAFNHTSITDYPGVSCIFYSDCDGYSDVTVLKQGLDYVDQHSDGYERWGDYLGIQRVFNNPGKVWTSGFYGAGGTQKSSSIWMSELEAPEFNMPDIVVDTQANLFGDNCETQLYLSGQNGAEPYAFIWNGEPVNNNQVTVNLCGEDYTVQMTDANNCLVTQSGSFEIELPNSQVFPNPFDNRFSVTFDLNTASNVRFTLVDIKGSLIREWYMESVREGSNQFSFSTADLRSGVYNLIIQADGREIMNEKLLKIE